MSDSPSSKKQISAVNERNGIFSSFMNDSDSDKRVSRELVFIVSENFGFYLVRSKTSAAENIGCYFQKRVLLFLDFEIILI